MFSLEDRAVVALAEAWRLLPPIKRQADIAEIGLVDLGAKHGTYDLDTHALLLSTRLFDGFSHMVPLIDIHGNDPPQTTPCSSRALHTATHECAHAIGVATGLDSTSTWLRLSSWVQAEDTPQGTARYTEDRPGWEQGPSDWRYRAGSWFPRKYSSKSPHEDFADCVAHVALGWHDFFVTPSGIAKLAYIRRAVWEEAGPLSIAAARDRWAGRLQAARGTPRKRSFTQPTVTTLLEETQEDIENAVQQENKRQYAALLALLLAGDTNLAGHVTAQDRRAFIAAIAPALFALYAGAYQRVAGTATMPVLTEEVLAAVARSAQSYTATTQRLLDEQGFGTPGVPLSQAEAVGRLEEVFSHSNTVRARQVAETETHRMAQAAQMDARVASGAGYGVWRTTSAKPCEYCAALDGQKVQLGEALFLKGHRLQGANGREMKLDYEDVFHPPLHVACACILDE